MTILRVHGPDKGTRLTDGTTLTFSLAHTPTDGNVLIACIGLADDAGSVSSISQTGVTWTKQVSQYMEGPYDVDAEIWAGIVGSGAGTSLTITITLSEVIIANVCEYSGLDTSNLLDKYGSVAGNYTTSQVTGTTATTTQNDELWIGCISVQKDSSSNDSSTPTNGFTLIDGIHLPRNTCCYLEKIVSSEGTASSGVTTTYPTYLAYAGCIATFKASSPTKIKTVSIDTTLKKFGATESASLDVILVSAIPTPPSTGETLVLTNSNGTLWCKPLKWKESQNCTPAIRPLPLASSEYLDSDTYVLKPRTIEVELRLSDREKKVFELIYNYASTTGINQYTDFYLYYDDSAYIWHYIAWIHDKKYNWEYSREDGRYVRWWYLTFTLDVLDFTGSSDTLPQYSLSTVTVNNETFDFVTNFERADQHPPAKPEWINQTEAVDSYIWNECVLDVAYTCRMTNAEKYYIDESLRAHTKVVWEDYIHNLFSISGGTNGVWISSVEAEYDSTNWAKPWKVTVSIKANNSEIESRYGTLHLDSLAYPSGTDHLGTMYLDELPDAESLPTSTIQDVGVHIFYFYLPDAATSFHDWVLSGDVIELEEYTFDRESILTVLITGYCYVTARYDVPAPPSVITFLSGDYEPNPCGGGTEFIELDYGYINSISVPFTESLELNTSYPLQFNSDINHKTYVFVDWECSSNITITDSTVNPTTFTINSGTIGWIRAIIISTTCVITLRDFSTFGSGATHDVGIIDIDGIDYQLNPTTHPQVTLLTGPHTITYKPAYDPSSVHENVLNRGFETGEFTDWSVVCASGCNPDWQGHYDCPYIESNITHSGSEAVGFICPVTCTLTQTFATPIPMGSITACGLWYYAPDSLGHLSQLQIFLHCTNGTTYLVAVIGTDVSGWTYIDGMGIIHGLSPSLLVDQIIIGAYSADFGTDWAVFIDDVTLQSEYPYTFDHWAVSGSLKVDSSTANPTTLNITGSVAGELDAYFNHSNSPFPLPPNRGGRP